MAPRGTNGSIHGMSLLVGELKGAVESVTRTVEHLNNNWKMKDEEATRGRETLRRDFDSLKDVVFGVKTDVRAVDTKIDGVHQSVAEMQNDMSDAKRKLETIEQHKPIIMAAIGEVDALKKFKMTLENKEIRSLGRWDVIKAQLTFGRVVGGAFGCGAIGLLFYWLQKFV